MRRIMYCFMFLMCLHVEQSFALSCGTNCEYTLEDGLLYVYGTGANNSGRLDKQSAFLRNSQIKNVIIEDGISYIGDNAFTMAGPINNFEIRSENIEINPYAFDYNTIPANMITKNVSIKCGTNCMLHIDEDGNAVMTGSGTIHSTYGNIPPPLFRNKIVSLEIDEGLTEITSHGLNNCNNLTSLYIKNEDFKISNSNAFNKGKIKEVQTLSKANSSIQKYFGENVKYTYIPKRIYTVDEANKTVSKGKGNNTFSIKYR